MPLKGGEIMKRRMALLILFSFLVMAASPTLAEEGILAEEEEVLTEEEGSLEEKLERIEEAQRGIEKIKKGQESVDESKDQEEMDRRAAPRGSY